MFTFGNVAIGKNTADYKLDILESTGDRGINVLVSGANSGNIFGTTIENSNSGNGSHWGNLITLSGTGSGGQFGSFYSISNTGDGQHDGIVINLGGAGDGIQHGIRNFISNSGSSLHYGVLNQLSGSGSSPHHGTSNVLYGGGTGLRIGMSNTLYGGNSGIQYGVYNHIYNTGGNSHFGIYNRLSGSNTGQIYGFSNEISNTGSGIHYGSYNDLSGSGIGPQYGVYNNITNSGGLLFGTYNYISGNNPNSIEGTTNFITNNGDGQHYGNFNELVGSGNGDQYGVKNLIFNSGSGFHYGFFNEISGSGSGNHYGVINDLTGSGTGDKFGTVNNVNSAGNFTVYGTHNALGGSGTGIHYGNLNQLSGFGDGTQIANYQEINNDGDGHHYGVKNWLWGTGSGNKYGIHSFIDNTAGGTHYGLHSEVLKAGSYAGYFLGNVSIGTTIGNSYILPVSRGTANQVMQTDGAGNLGWVNTSTIGDDLGNHGATTTLDLNSNQINEVFKINMLPQSNYDKYRLYNNAITTIGMHDNMTYGFLNNDWAMTFTVQDDADRGWIWRDLNDAQSDGAMSLTADGRMTLKSHLRVDTNTLSVDATNNRVGIGTTTPGHVLDVNGRMRVRNTGGTSGIWYSQGAVDRQFAGVQSHSATGTSQKWGVYNNGNWRFTVQGNGNVGIGTTNPTARLQVDGGRVEFTATTDASGTAGSGVLEIANALRFDANEIITNTNSILYIQNDNNGDLRVDSNSFVVDASLNRIGLGLTNPSYQLHLTLNSAAKPISNAWTVFSDARLKTNVKPFTDGLELIKQINPVWFTYNGKAGMPIESGVGTLAQEFQKIAPYMVKPWEYTNEDDTVSESYLGIDYGPLNFVMVNAIQEQQEIIENQNTKIESLEQQLKQQQFEINEIKGLLKNQ